MTAAAEIRLDATPYGAGDRVHFARRVGSYYLRSGLGILRRSPGVYAILFALITACAAVASYLTVREVDLPAAGLIALTLDTISATVAPVIVMAAVAVGGHGGGPRVVDSIRTGLPWLPRYVWTNLHTTFVFWIPVGAILVAMRWQETHLPLQGAAGTAVLVAWISAIVVAALYFHTRTILAPFFAVHGNMPGTIAALESWRISGRYFPVVFGTFIVAALPPAVVPLAIFCGALLALHGSGMGTAHLIAATSSLVWAGIQFVRPFLVSAVYVLHRDIWDVEQARRDRDGHPPVPPTLRPLVALSLTAGRGAGALAARLSRG